MFSTLVIMRAMHLHVAEAGFLTRCRAASVHDGIPCFDRDVCEQLERLQQCEAGAACEESAAATAAASIAEVQAEVAATRLALESREAEAEALRAALAERQTEAARASEDLDEVGRFLMACMQDVKSKVVEVARISEPDEDAEISVLPGSALPCPANECDNSLIYLLMDMREVGRTHQAS
jgi:hypothetical protein